MRRQSSVDFASAKEHRLVGKCYVHLDGPGSASAPRRKPFKWAVSVWAPTPADFFESVVEEHFETEAEARAFYSNDAIVLLPRE